MRKAVMVGTTMSEELRTQLEQIAAANDRTLSAEVRRAVKWYVAGFHPEKKAA